MTERAQRLFEQVLAVADDDRDRHLDAACGGDHALRQEVNALLADARAADNFFDRLNEAVFSSSSSTESEIPPPAWPALELREGETVGHYRIASLIGRGGMGAVFRAYDTRLNRDVALKFLNSQIDADSDEHARLLTEARAAASLDHPNVCSIHEIGETADGRHFIAMPCYSGETLKERLRRGRLELEESAAIALQIARGLAAAHARGIIHRDVKPGNVMILADGSVRLLDFGLAVAVNQDLIRSGITPGTVAYMSPEQIRGTTLDARTDLWSLGVLLYEMIAGVRPFRGENYRALIQSILRDDAPPLAHHRPETGASLTDTVSRLLQKDPEARYPDSTAVVRALEHAHASISHDVRQHSPKGKRALFGGIAFSLLLIGIVVIFRALGENDAFQARVARAWPSIAVLPLTNLGSDTTDAALATGITEELIATLAGAGDVRVIASTSVARLERSGMDVRQIADSLGVMNVLEGGLQKVGPHVRVQVRLIDGHDGTTRWSQSYDRQFKDMLAVQTEIVAAVAGELQLRFDKDRQFSRHRTRNIDAYELYLRGSDPVLLRSQSGIWRAQDYFQKAISADPTYAAAHAALSLVYVRRARNASDPGMPVPALLDLAASEAQKAIAIDSTLAEGHYARGRVYEATLQFSAAESSIRRAIALDPNRSVYRRALSFMKAWTGTPAEELAEAQVALETDPLNPYAVTAVASGLYANRRYDEALAQFEKVAALKPPLQGAMFAIAQCYAKKGMWDKAIATLRPGAESGDPLFTALLGYMLGRTGQREEANRILGEVMARRSRTGVGAFHVAIIHAGLGNMDETFSWLGKSVDDRSIVSFIMGPTFEDLRRDPRFNALRRRLGLMS